jgi:receptor L domain-containing protein
MARVLASDEQFQRGVPSHGAARKGSHREGGRLQLGGVGRRPGRRWSSAASTIAALGPLLTMATRARARASAQTRLTLDQLTLHEDAGQHASMLTSEQSASTAPASGLHGARGDTPLLHDARRNGKCLVTASKKPRVTARWCWMLGGLLASCSGWEDPLGASLGGAEGVGASPLGALRQQLAVPEPSVATPLPTGLELAGIVSINTPRDLARLEGVVAIRGDLIIEGSVSDLSALSSLRAVGGSLTLRDNRFLTDLDGLSSLAQVGGAVSIDANARLRDIGGLRGLKHMESLSIRGNPVLEDLEGLSRLESAGFVELWANPAVASLRGLERLARVDGVLQISGAGLTHLGGLDSLASVGSLSIAGNARLTNLDGLPTLARVGTLYLNGNDALSDVRGLSSLLEVGELNLYGNRSLTDLSGLSGLQQLRRLVLSATALSSLDSLAVLGGLGRIEYLSAYANPLLTDLRGLGNLGEVDEAYLADNAALRSLDGLSHVTRMGSLTLERNPALADIGALRQLRTLDGGLAIAGNPALTSLDGLRALRSLGADLRIEDNATLGSLDGLNGVTTVGGVLTLQHNPALSNVAGLERLERVGSPSLDGPALKITDNAALSNLDGLRSLELIANGLELIGNGALAHVDGLRRLAALDVLDISGNGSLTQLRGLRGLAAPLERLTVAWNGVLPACEADWLEHRVADASTRVELMNNGQAGTHPLVYQGYVSVGRASDLLQLEGVEVLDGSLRITDQAITDVSALGALVEITGSLTIDGTSLPNLDGLHNLRRVGYLALDTNRALANVDGLSQLTSIGTDDYIGSLYISGNPALSSLRGLGALTPLGPGGDVSVTNNPLLPTCEARALAERIGSAAGRAETHGNAPDACSPAIPFIGGSITLREQEDVERLRGVERVEGDVIIEGSVGDLSALRSLRSIGGWLVIQDTESLTTLAGLGTGLSLDGLQIRNNPLLTRLDGLDVSYASSVHILGNAALTQVDALGSNTSVLILADNPALSSIAALSTSAYSLQYLAISNNPRLPTCEARLLADASPGGSVWLADTDPEGVCAGSVEPAGTVIDGSVSVSKPEELERLRGVTLITGDLSIAGTVTDLTPLAELAEVRGTLSIYQASELASLQGLGRLTRAGALSIVGNPQLWGLRGLGALGSLGSLEIANATFTSLAGLEQLGVVDDRLDVFNNPALTSLDGLQGLGSVGGSLSLYGNPALIDLGALRSLRVAGTSLQIQNNDALRDLVGLEGLAQLGSLGITQNDGIERLDGLTNLVEVETIDLRDNPRLVDLSALHGVSRIYQLTLDAAPALESLTGLEGLSYVASSLTLSSNPALTDLRALAHLTSAGSLIVKDNAALAHLAGLENLESLGELTLSGNPVLEDVASLSSLSGVGSLDVRDNPMLESLSGWGALTSVYESVIIAGNKRLSGLDWPALSLVQPLLYLSVSYNPELPTCAAESLSAIVTDASTHGVIRGNARHADASCGALPAGEAGSEGLPPPAGIRADRRPRVPLLSCGF